MSLSPGTTLGPYRIVSQLGQGGMGVVYQAHDPRLDRHVAIKLLPPDLTRDEIAKQRFLQEAKAASALDHPNICNIHEINETPDGQLYLVMAHYEGETLKERIARRPLDLNDAIDIATQVGEGLAEAHGAGIVHRDIKPANLLVTKTGVVKILDFGLAKLAGSEGVTQTGTTVGTVAYMSPEQAKGQEVDHRTDIWSLGVVLYEMLAGTPPFAGENLLSLSNAIMDGEPSLLTGASSSAHGVVTKALSKDRARRYQAVTDLLGEMRALQSGPDAATVAARTKADVPSIAVLPFADMSPEKDQDYFCEGMAEEILNALTGLEGLHVAARTSSFQFKGQNLNIVRIGQELNVRTVLEGSVRKAGNRLRITAQLISVQDGYHLWSERYDRDMDDIFAIQDDIAGAVVQKLQVKLLGDAKTSLVRRPTDDLEAYNLYLQGRYYWSRRYKGFLAKAVKYFEQAIARDSSCAPAHAGLADGYTILATYGFLTPAEARGRALPAARTAIALDDSLDEGHRAMGLAQWGLEWDPLAAEEELRRAIAINPRSGLNHGVLGVVLACTGRRADGVAEANQARQLEPTSIMAGFYAIIGYYNGREDRLALDECRRVLELDPSFAFAFVIQARVLASQGRHLEAIKSAERSVELSGRANNYFLMALGTAYALSGRHADARAILGELDTRSREQYVSAFSFAMIHTALGENEQAIKFFTRVFEERDPNGIVMIWDRALDPLRSDPRFQALLKKMNFPAQPQS